MPEDSGLTGEDLLDGSAQPDVVQATGALRRAGADVGEQRGRHQRTELLLPQDVQLGTLRGASEVSQYDQLLLTCGDQ